MILPEAIAKQIIRKLIHGEDYRIELVALIKANFLQHGIEFFKKIVDAKLNNTDITLDWYKANFLSPSLSSKDIAINSGLNMKTISNMHNTGRRDVVIEASNAHYDEICKVIEELIEADNEIDIVLTIKLRDVSVNLTINESLIVINALAVKRAELRGGLWSTAGKRVETPLMLTLCRLFNVNSSYYSTKDGGHIVDPLATFKREIDFYLIIQSGEEKKCEVKLMGKGNPESADAFIARASDVFIADKLSDTNKAQLTSRNVQWVELRHENGFMKFGAVLKYFNIPYKEPIGNIDSSLEKIFSEIFQ
jgi:hypothetical protein